MKIVLSLVLLAASAAANTVWIEFFPETNCTGDWLENTVYTDRDAGAGVCRVETLTTWKPYYSFKIRGNTAGRPR
jgi:hypothetical protein